MGTIPYELKEIYPIKQEKVHFSVVIDYRVYRIENGSISHPDWLQIFTQIFKSHR